MGGDADLEKAKQRIGDKVCMIGGFDQFHFFQGCTSAETRAEVRRCFAAAGHGGGYILAPSDHFFDAAPELIKRLPKKRADASTRGPAIAKYPFDIYSAINGTHPGVIVFDELTWTGATVSAT